MKNSAKNKKKSIEEIEALAARGEGVTRFFFWRRKNDAGIP